MSSAAVQWKDGSRQGCTQCLLSAISRGMGMQVPPPDPEAWRLRVFAEGVAEAAAKYARREHGDDWL